MSWLILVVPLLVTAQNLERRANFGVQVAPLTPAQRELTDHVLNIVRVFENSTASRFGLEADQIILRANGVPPDIGFS